MGLFGKKKDDKAEDVKLCSCSECDTSGEDQVNCTEAGSACIKVLGSGCKNCQLLYNNIRAAVRALNITAQVEYITDLREVSKYGTMSMPALVINEQIISVGRVLQIAEVVYLLNKYGLKKTED